jgi:hypothetical protein
MRFKTKRMRAFFHAYERVVEGWRRLREFIGIQLAGTTRVRVAGVVGVGIGLGAAGSVVSALG